MVARFIIQVRDYHESFTESKLYVPELGKDVWVLEDVGRPEGVKIDGKTCIPELLLKVAITRSNRFKKDMMLLYNRDDFSVEWNGVRFTGVRPHGGNHVDNTEGCPLCNYETDHKGKQWGRASDDIFNLVKQWLSQGDEVYWLITSKK